MRYWDGFHIQAANGLILKRRRRRPRSCRRCDKVQGMLYERTAISRKPEELARLELEALKGRTA